MPSLEDRFWSLDCAQLEGFVETQQEENLHLEFKTVSGPEFRSSDDRRNLARAVSGFANSEGGLIVWGVDARRKGEGPDCASALVPIPSVSCLLSRLNELTSEALSPVHSQVQHRVVHEADDGSGYAATLVGASDSGPHMAKLGVDQYFKRAGDSFVRMEHFDIADMFGRRPRPDLRLRLTAIPAGLDSGTDGSPIQRYTIFAAIENLGRGSAAAPFLSVTIEPPYRLDKYGVDGNGHFGLPQVPGRFLKTCFGASSDIMIHPGTARDVFTVQGYFEVENPRVVGLVINYELAAQDVPLQTATTLFSPEEILKGLREWTG